MTTKFMDKYRVNGKEMILTEEQAEEFDSEGLDVVWVSSVRVEEDDLPNPLPDGAADDLLECTCENEDDLCPSCRLIFESMRDDDEIPFMF